jgi:hypothetical protein
VNATAAALEVFDPQPPAISSNAKPSAGSTSGRVNGCASRESHLRAQW